LFQNARELKEVIDFLKMNLKIHDETFQGKGEVEDILNNMGFVSTITKEEAGKDYYRQEALNIYKICEETLFKQFGGMVSLLDLYYFYNRKRQTCLISPEEILKACKQFEKLGLGARIIEYPNNVKMI
jgi:ESCRT-II complex subunit VPS36